MRPEKELLLDEITDQIKLNPSFLIFSYNRLNANVANDVRRSVTMKGGSIEMTRKRILVKAAEKAGVSLDLNTLSGHIGLIFVGADPIETTKLVFKFSQDTEQAIEVIGGRIDGQLYSGAQVQMLSTLPSKDEMRAQFLGTLEAPMSQTLAVMEALLTSVAHCLENKCQQQGSQGE